MRGAHNEVGVGNQAVVIGGVIVNQGATGCFHTTHPSSCFGVDLGTNIRVANFWIFQQLNSMLVGIHILDQPGIMIEQGQLRGPPESLAKLLQLRLRPWRRDAITRIDASKTVGPVDSLGIVDIEGKALIPAAGIREFTVGIGDHSFAQIVHVILGTEIHKGAVGFHQAQLAVVEGEITLVVHGTEKTGGDDPKGFHHIQVLGEDIGFGKLEGVVREFQQDL